MKGNAYSRGYGRAWQKARAAFLVEHPICSYCERLDKLVRATVVDHITPHKGDQLLFWDRDNWQPLCKRCHDSIKQKEEGGKLVGCNAAGVPLSRSHHWTHGVGAGRKSRAASLKTVAPPFLS